MKHTVRPVEKDWPINPNILNLNQYRLPILGSIGLAAAGLLALFSSLASAQNLRNNPNSNHGNKFEQLGIILPDANSYRTASGAPGHEYWQQRADYEIEAELDEDAQVLRGAELITYTNHSPDLLNYLWLQLDENEHHPQAESNYFNESRLGRRMTESDLERMLPARMLEGHGVQIFEVSDGKGLSLPYTINQTMMRVDLREPLRPGKRAQLKIRWQYKIPDRMKVGGRGGYEQLKDGNILFTITQWFPRLCVYSDYQGWNHKQFTGRGEFSLPFGDYKVRMNVPADHVVVSTGTCSNYKQVLSSDQYSRWQKAQSALEPVEIVTREEALGKESTRAKERKTWVFEAKNVRDFAWGSSRRFIWDAMAVDIAGKKVMAMSAYPKESYALYRKYSTKVVAHTLRVYSKHTIPYPYPVAISVEASNGMEYPMICFNYGRTLEDGTYSEQTKYGMIGVIIHEVGHNFFPMIINSDERNWSWMDEGLNTFVQFLTEQEFDNQYPSRRGPAHRIADYMRLPADQLEPIMTNSENIMQFGPNAYGKPATALNILRETVMGRDLFDFAFRTYAQRWAFRHPSPADFFRTMEDASGVDLDWFWRAWFFDIEPVDISLDSVRVLTPTDSMPGSLSGSPITDRNRDRMGRASEGKHISALRNKASGMKFLVDLDTSLRDFYYFYNDSLRKVDENEPRLSAVRGSEWNDSLISQPQIDGKPVFVYELHLRNAGGCVMPVILRWEFEDGTSQEDRISAYVWRKNEQQIVKTFVHFKPVRSVLVDPHRETADIDTSNNLWPRDDAQMVPGRVVMYKSRRETAGRRSTPELANPMQIRTTGQ